MKIDQEQLIDSKPFQGTGTVLALASSMLRKRINNVNSNNTHI